MAQRRLQSFSARHKEDTMNKESIALQQIRQHIKARAALLYIDETISTKCPKCGGTLKIRRVTDRNASASCDCGILEVIENIYWREA